MRPSWAFARRGAGLAALFLLGIALFGGTSASAETTRPLVKQIPFPDGRDPMGIATDSAGNLYVNVRINPAVGLYGMVEKFDSEGNPVNFTASAPYIEGNRIIGRPSAGEPEEPPFYGIQFDSSFPNGIAVDNTGGANNGYFYITPTFNDGGAIWAYKPNGEYAGPLTANGFSCQVSVNQVNGDIYTGLESSTVNRFAPAATFAGTVPDGSLGTNGNNCAMAVDDPGNLYSVPNAEYASGPIMKYPAANFEGAGASPTEVFAGPVNSLAYDHASGNLFAGNGEQVQELTTGGTTVNAPFGGFLNSRGVTAVPGNKVAVTNLGEGTGSLEIYGPPASLPIDTAEPVVEPLQTTATLNGNVDPDGPSPVTKCEFQWGTDIRYKGTPVPCSQATPIAAPTAVSAELTGLTKTTIYHYRVVTTSAGGVQVSKDLTFRTPDVVADVETGGPEPVSKDSALLHGSYRGQGKDTEYFFEIGTEANSYTKSVPSTPLHTGAQSGPHQVTPVEVTGLHGATEYHYRVVMTNDLGTAYGSDQSFVTPPSINELETGGVTNVTNESAELNGSFTADKYEVHYFFEWGPSESYGTKSPIEPGSALPPGSGHVDVPPVLIENIQEGGIYHYRIVASNETGTTYGQDRVFKTAEPPQISNLGSKNVKISSADLTAEINPNRSETTWYFEWGLTTSYGNKTPVPPETVPAGSEPVPVEVHLEGLEVEKTYHFRLVASNQFGTRQTGDQAFGFYPPSCPNSQVRQETNSSHIPDCRAYELVTPSNANGATIEPLNAPSSGYATSPARLAFSASYGELPEAGEPLISVADMYVATRTFKGWVSKYVGKHARETSFMAGPPHGGIYGTTNYGANNSYFGAAADSSLSRIVLYDLGYPGFFEEIEPPTNTPFVFDTTTDQQLARWPTNVAEVPGAADFVGWQAFSSDLSHFVFSSNVAFVEGAESFPAHIKCCSPDFSEYEEGRCCPGPIYDNDTETGAIEVISEREDETPFQGVPLKVSSDGSHILMSETGDSLVHYPRPLYMRMGGRTYDIAGGAPVRFVSMTNDGSTVYFTSTEQLNSEDTDHSLDLYVWHEGDPTSVTLVSKGATGSAGNRDNCELSWVESCDIQIIEVSNPVFAGSSNGNVSGNQTTDTNTASESGDIYFVSPEQLDGARGSFGQANVYLYHDGSVRFVVSAEPETCIGVRPSFFGTGNCEAGKISRMQVTPNGEYAAFITKSRLLPYNNNGKTEMYLYTRSQNRLDCASCRPDGQPASNDTYGSQNGLFLTEDGRAFFSTDEGIALADTDNSNDVYEYVEGKPQLLTSGTGEPNVTTGFQGVLTAPGLVGVSANGTDVYFATQDSLVTQDHNGQAIKLYDARSGGGFPAEPPKPECAAADECHGEGSVAPELPKDRTSPALEGNPKQTSTKTGKNSKKKHKKHHKKHKKSKHGEKRANRAG